MTIGPIPSMSRDERPVKWMSRSQRCAGQSGLTQRRATSPSSRTSPEPHTGQATGGTQGTASAGRFSGTTRTISGMTSPALWTTTVSPARTSLRATSSSLWRVQRCTVEPAISTGSRKATGVQVPVRPTLTRISCTRVSRSSGGNLYAMAQRGERDTAPSSAWISRWSTLMTTPSVP